MDRKNGGQSTSISIKLKVELRGEVGEDEDEYGDVNDKLKGCRAEGCFPFFSSLLLYYSGTRAVIFSISFEMKFWKRFK